MSIIHVTERATFKSCRRQWKYQYLEHLLPPTDKIDARWLGRGIHFALAEFYREPGNRWKEPFDEWLEKKLDERHSVQGPMTEDEKAKIEETRTLVYGMLTGYEKYAAANDDFEVIDTEIPVSIQIPGTRGRLTGTIDMVVQRKGRLWVLDHKTFTSFADPEALDLDDQMTAYLWLVWRTYGEMPAGAIYNQLRKRLPAKPMLLKDGTRLSKDKSIDTTYDVYLATILENGFNPAEYADILDKLTGNEFYRREVIPRNSHELETFEENLIAEYRDMSSKRTVLYANPTRECTWCDYRLLCKAENEKGDVNSLKENLFVVEPERRL